MTANAGTISALPRAAGRPVAAIAVGGVIVGLLDLAYAIIVYSRDAPS